MNLKATEVKQLAAQILAGLMANPHIYSQISDEGGRGQTERNLTTLAIELATGLAERVDSMSSSAGDRNTP